MEKGLNRRGRSSVPGSMPTRLPGLPANPGPDIRLASLLILLCPRRLVSKNAPVLAFRALAGEVLVKRPESFLSQ